MLLLAGGSWYQAWATPPYRYIDEQAHVGYVLSLQRGHLPTIDSPIDSADGGAALRERLAAEPARRRDVWVANNPPLAYVVALPSATATRALGVVGGPLLGLRLANVAATAGAVALSYLLGRDLSRGDRTVGVSTAALVALLPHVGFVAALGFNDGIALLATTGVLRALVALLNSTREIDANAAGVPHIRWGGGGRGALVLGVWCAAAAAVRPMGLAFAAAAGLLGLIGTWGRTAVLPTVARLGGPTVVLAGWWYARNVARYGDATGSEALFDKFLREPSGSIWSKLRDDTIWESAFRTIATRRTDAPLASDPVVWFRVAEVLAVAGVAATVVLVVLGRRDHGEQPAVAAALPPLPARAWAAVGALSAVPVVLTAQHAAGGGNPHPRYLLPAVPVLAAALATALVRLAGRVATAVVLAGLAMLTAVQARASIRDLADNPIAGPGSALASPAGPTWVQALGVAAAAVGLVLVLGSVLGLVPPLRPTPPEPQDPGGA
ncbi:MAG: hypothetical protein R2746_05360 [Acidimicrobiales bacterium]